jgi:hypothetical protein
MLAKSQVWQCQYLSQARTQGTQAWIAFRLEVVIDLTPSLNPSHFTRRLKQDIRPGEEK